MRRVLFFIFLSHFTESISLFASDIPLNRPFPVQETLPRQLFAFQKSYLGGGIVKTNPASFTENDYEYGVLCPFAQYRFFLHDTWVIGVSAGFKSLFSNYHSDLSMFSVSEEFSRIFRIYHPSWIGLGFKSMYLVGVEKISLPYERDPDQPPQVGVGANLTLFYLVGRDKLLHAELSRWRGTINNRLHVLEFSAGIDFGLE